MTAIPTDTEFGDVLYERVEPNECDGQDLFLTSMVKFANGLRRPLEQGEPFTLFVNGMIVSGELIPDWQWFGEQGQEHASRTGKTEQLLTLIGQQKRESNENLTPKSIHLRNAQVFNATNVDMPLFYWRGQLKHVTGWIYGELRPTGWQAPVRLRS